MKYTALKPLRTKEKRVEAGEEVKIIDKEVAKKLLAIKAIQEIK